MAAAALREQHFLLIIAGQPGNDLRQSCFFVGHRLGFQREVDALRVAADKLDTVSVLGLEIGQLDAQRIDAGRNVRPIREGVIAPCIGVDGDGHVAVRAMHRHGNPREGLGRRGNNPAAEQRYPDPGEEGGAAAQVAPQKRPAAAAAVHRFIAIILGCVWRLKHNRKRPGLSRIARIRNNSEKAVFQGIYDLVCPGYPQQYPCRKLAAAGRSQTTGVLD